MLVLVRHLLQAEQVLLDLYILLILVGGHSVPGTVNDVQLKTSSSDDHSIALVGWHVTRHLVGQLGMAIAQIGWSVRWRRELIVHFCCGVVVGSASHGPRASHSPSRVLHVSKGRLRLIDVVDARPLYVQLVFSVRFRYRNASLLNLRRRLPRESLIGRGCGYAILVTSECIVSKRVAHSLIG